MGSIGDCYDNSMIESFWARMQVELLDRRRWNTRIELANAMFEYLEIWHNRQRRHSRLGMLTPMEFENRQLIEVFSPGFALRGRLGRASLQVKPLRQPVSNVAWREPAPKSRDRSP